MNLYNIIFTGSEQALGAAQAMLAEAIEKNGKEHKVAFLIQHIHYLVYMLQQDKR